MTALVGQRRFLVRDHWVESRRQWIVRYVDVVVVAATSLHPSGYWHLLLERSNGELLDFVVANDSRLHLRPVPDTPAGRLCARRLRAKNG